MSEEKTKPSGSLYFKIGQNDDKSPVDLRKLAVTYSSERSSTKAGVKNS